MARTSVEEEIVSATPYAIDRSDEKQRKFQIALRHFGFTVKLKPYIQRSDGSTKGDWDVGIAMDMIRLSEKLDTVVLVSGDGDYQDLLEYLKAKGCRAEVIALGRTCSKKLLEVCDMFTDLEKNTKRFLAASTTRKKAKNIRKK